VVEEDDFLGHLWFLSHLLVSTFPPETDGGLNRSESWTRSGQ
jgi:hypothetical protein